ncbi:hypothetical protein NC653_021145 [Populus alba x Populus x berolinensis]|nr:hypothetical protein NC653_021145 [Populus alba x Populus x berolinensis]
MCEKELLYQGNMNIDSETFAFQPNARHPEVEPRPKPDHLGLNGAEIDSKMVKIGFEAPRGEADTKPMLALDRGADEPELERHLLPRTDEAILSPSIFSSTSKLPHLPCPQNVAQELLILATNENDPLSLRHGTKHQGTPNTYISSFGRLTFVNFRMTRHPGNVTA